MQDAGHGIVVRKSPLIGNRTRDLVIQTQERKHQADKAGKRQKDVQCTYPYIPTLTCLWILCRCDK